MLFDHTSAATELLGVDRHRHLSLLIGFFPGDRINTDDSPAELVDGVRALLTALPSAWAESGRVTGIGARGGFIVDLSWRAGAVTEAVLRNIGGMRTTVRCGPWSRDVQISPGESIILRP
jgi:hypothetical protein